jgi:tetratricopeptide (TPR) repeat protein
MNAWKKDVLGLTPTQHDTSLLSTFALSWLALRDETAQKMFQSAGYLAPNTAIPLEIFEKTLEITSEQCDEALTLLYGLGLLRENESQPTIHPLLAEYARGLSKEKLKILEALANTLGTLSREANETGLPVRFDSIKPHIPILALYAENEKIKSAGVLWNNYGYHLQDVADYSGSRAAYEHAIKISPNDATYINNLGGVMQAQGDLVGARAAHERALKIDPDNAPFINNLGSVMKAQGDLVGARAAFERALKIDEASLGSDHPNVAIRVNNLGGVMQDQGDLISARAALERAIKIWETHLGTEHPQVATGVNNLGLVMQDQGDLIGARAAFERAIAIFKKILPSDHPNIIIVQGNLDSLEK